MTDKHPWFEFEPGVFEIDEFDCASIFLIVGRERALLLDTGIGVGDLRRVVARLTDKPYDVVLTHGHGDHAGGSCAFPQVWLHPADTLKFPMEPALRRRYAEMIAHREHKHYPYDLDRDMQPGDTPPRVLPLRDGQVFDLGGRVLTVYECPGHTPGEVVLTDSASGILFCGDACNNNLGLANRPDSPGYVGVERAARALERILAMAGTGYDPAKVYNSHHDYRGFGAPLAPEVLPDATECCRRILAGDPPLAQVPEPMDPMSGRTRTVAMVGRTMVSF